MNKVRGISFYVGPDTGRPLEHANNLMLDDNGGLCRTFQKALLENQQKFNMRLQLMMFPPLTCQWIGCGQTASVAHWSRDGTIEAVTAYLVGVDRDEEELLVQLALAGKPLPIPLYRWHEELGNKPPIYATFLITPASVADPVIATVAPALANSFFGIFGEV